MAELIVRVTFLNPFRVVPWEQRENRKTSRIYMRGGTFAKWHREAGDFGRPYLTGTLLRSALLNELEKLLIFHNPFDCCPGKDKTETRETSIRKPDFLRKRPRYQFNDRRCNSQAPCPLCLIKGEYDTSRRREKIQGKDIGRWTVHFSNLSEATCINGKRAIFDWNEIAAKRIVNRVDFSSGKAKDYFDIWEIEHSTCPGFEGVITLNTKRIHEQGGEICSIKALIAAGLAQVNILAGSTCRIDILNEDHDQIIEDFASRKKARPSPEDRRTDSSPEDSSEIVETEEDIPGEKALVHTYLNDMAPLAAKISRIFAEDERSQRLRRLADAVRELRGEGPGIIDNLPKGKKEANPSDWDKKIGDGSERLRDILKTAFESVGENGSWRHFCEELGQTLYRQSKENRSRDEIQTLSRLLGETRYYGIPPRTDEEEYNLLVKKTTAPRLKWIITGTMRAETQFFFGKGDVKAQPFISREKQTKDVKEQLAMLPEEQTSMAVLLNGHDFFRLPSSVIRGALRRDIRAVIGTGCNMPVGAESVNAKYAELCAA